MRVTPILIGAVAIAVLAGCSAGPSSPGPGPGPDGGGSADNVESLPDPCTLVTKEEAAVPVGAPVADGQDDLISKPGMPTGRSCDYRVVTGGNGELSITVWPVDNELFGTYKENQKSFGDVVDIPGVGNAAFRVGWTELDVLNEGYLLEFAIQLVKYDPDVAIGNLTTLAKSSTQRL